MTRMVSVERAAALRNKCLNLTEKLSIGFRFGEGTDVAVATVDVAHWHIASFRCPAEFDRYRGIADSGKPAAQQVYEFTARLPTTATAGVWPVFPLPRDLIGHVHPAFSHRSYPGPCGRRSPVEMRKCRMLRTTSMLSV